MADIHPPDERDVYAHDTRLDLLTFSEYRLWHDSHNVMIPIGESTTQPLDKEIVPTNIKVYGAIHQSYFSPPWVDFVNANVVTERFDRYKLQTWRYKDNLPYETTHIDYHDDLHLLGLKVGYYIKFMCNDIIGESFGQTWFNYEKHQNWITEELHGKIKGLVYIAFDLEMITNPDNNQKAKGFLYPTTQLLQKVNLPVTIIVKRAHYYNGNSDMELLVKNNITFPLNLIDCKIEIIGGE